jgi:hypothetical protein
MRIASRCTLLLAQALIFLAPMFAYNDWLPVTPEELKMTSIPQQPGAPAVELYREELYDDVAHTQSFYTRIKILTETGKKYADVQIPYESRFQDVSFVRGRTIQPDGSISPFEGKPLDRVLEKGDGRNWKVKSFAVPNAQVGSIIEYRYTRNYDNWWYFPPTWNLQGELFRVKEYFAFTPTAGGVAWTWRTAPNFPMPQRSVGGKLGAFYERVELMLTDVPAFVAEPDMPPANLFRYNVHFYYDSHRGKPDVFWKKEGKYWIKDVEHFTTKRAGLTEAVRAVVSPSDTPEQKARKIYAFVQSLQNLDFSPRRSEEEMKMLGLKDVRGVEDVLRQKMGDGEDLARLYLAMAREAGLNAHLMCIATRDDNSYFDEQYLNSDQLNHEIVALKLDSGLLYLDPGVRFCPFGLLFWKHADTRGLLQGDGKDAQLGDVPDSGYQDAWLVREAQLWLGSDGRLQGTVEVTYKGQRALVFRVQHWQTDEAGKKKAIEDELKRMLPENAEVQLVNRPEWDSDRDLVAKFKVSSPAASSAGHRVLLPLDIVEHGHAPRFPLAEREYPVGFDYPWRTTDHFQLLLPQGFRVENLPAAVSEKLPYAIYEVKVAEQGGQIEVLRDLVMSSIIFPKKQYSEIKSFFDKVKGGDDAEVLLKPSLTASRQ